MTDADYDNLDIFMDFYTEVANVDSEADIIPFVHYDMMVPYCKVKFRDVVERNGKPDFTDGDWLEFKEMLGDAIRKETSGQKFKQKPRINRITDSRGTKLPFDRA